MISWSTLLLAMAIAFSCRMPGAGATTQAGTDSLIVADSRQKIVLDKANPQVQVQLTGKESVRVSSGKGYYICFDGLQVEEFPEGSHEIYLSTSQLPTAELVPESRFFLNVLNLFGLPEKSAGPPVCIRATRQLIELSSSTGPPKYYVTVIFKGNLSSDGKASANAGKLVFQRIRIVQVDQ